MGCKKENQSKLKEDKFIFKENVFAQTTTLGLEVSIPPGILNLQSHTHCGLKLTNRTRSVWLSAPSGIHVYFPRIELTWLLRRIKIERQNRIEFWTLWSPVARLTGLKFQLLKQILLKSNCRLRGERFSRGRIQPGLKILARFLQTGLELSARPNGTENR